MIFEKSSFRAVCCLVHAFLLVYGFFPLIAGMTGMDSFHCFCYCAIGFLLLIPITASWLLLRRLKYLWLYLPIGLALSAIIGITGGGLCQLSGCNFLYSVPLTAAACAIISLVVFFIHATSRIRLADLKKDFIAAHGYNVPFDMKVWEVPTILNHPSPVHFIWFVVQYVLALVLKNSLYWHFLFFMLLLDILVCFSFQYMNNFDRFVTENSQTANLPVSTMKQVHRILFSIALLLIVLFALPSIFFGQEPLANLRMEDVPITFKQEENASGNLTLDDLNYGMPLPDILTESQEEHNPPVWIGYVVRAVLLLMFAAALVVLILSIIRAVRRANALFSETKEDEILFIDSETSDERTSIKRKKTPREGRFSINMQIRRKYKKTIRRATKGLPNRWATPLELEQNAQIADRDDTRQLHALYEKARYSESGCTKDDYC